MTNRDFTFRLLNESDLDQLISLQELVYSTLDDQASLSTLSEEEFIDLIRGKGWLVGVFIEKQLIASRALLIPSVDEKDHLGKDAGIARSELDQVIYQEISIVNPAFRGYHLQQQMGEWLMKMLENSQHKYRYLCATVAPANIASMKDKFNQNMQIVALKKKYNEKWRYIFFKDLTQNEMNQALEDESWVLSNDLSEQNDLLKRGFVGTGIRVKNEVNQLSFTIAKRPKNE